MCSTYVPGTCRGQKRRSDSLELAVVSHLVWVPVQEQDVLNH